MSRNCALIAIFTSLFIAADVMSETVRFRMELTTMGGAPNDTISVGEEFLFKTYTQHVGGYTNAADGGVFSGYLDVNFDAGLASVTGAIDHSELYSEATSGDVSTPGFMDNVGGIGIVAGLTPLGVAEELLFSVPMLANQIGTLSFVGSSSLSSQYPVLVYGENDTIPVGEVDFGMIEATIVPEPRALGPLLLAGAVLLFRRRLRRHELRGDFLC